MSNSNTGYPPYPYYNPATQQQQQHHQQLHSLSDQRNVQRNGLSNQLLGQVGMVGGAGEVSQGYTSRQDNSDYFGLPQHQWGAQSPTYSELHGGTHSSLSYDSKASRVATLGSVSASRMSDNSSTAVNTLQPSDKSYQHQQQLHYIRGSHQPVPTAQYSGHHGTSDQGRIVTSNTKSMSSLPSSYATAPSMATTVEPPQPGFSHVYQQSNAVQPPNQTRAGYSQVQNQTRARHTKPQPVVSSTTSYHTATQLSKTAALTSTTEQGQPQRGSNRSLSAHTNAQQISQTHPHYGQYTLHQTQAHQSQQQQFDQLGQSASNQATGSYMQAVKQPASAVRSQIPSLSFQTTYQPSSSSTPNAPSVNNYCSPPLTNTTCVDTQGLYHTHGAMSAPRGTQSYTPSNTNQSPENSSTDNNFGNARAQRQYINVDALPPGRAKTHIQTPVRKQTPPQSTLKPSPMVPQSHLHNSTLDDSYLQAQAQAKMKTQAQAQAKVLAQAKVQTKSTPQVQLSPELHQEVAPPPQDNMHPNQTPEPASESAEAKVTGHPSSRPSERVIDYKAMERHMREMVERMREYQTLDPAGFHTVWENVKKGGVLSSGTKHGATPEPQEKDLPGVSVSPNPSSDGGRFGSGPSAATSSMAESEVTITTESLGSLDNVLQNSTQMQSTTPDTSSSPIMGQQSQCATQGYTQISQPGTVLGTSQHDKQGTPVAAKASLVIQHSRHVSGDNHHANGGGNVNLPTTGLSTSTDSLSVKAPIQLMEQPSQVTTHVWPEKQKVTLATCASNYIASNGLRNMHLPVEYVVSLLDTNPSFVVLCEKLEQDGYNFERSSLARAMLNATPQDQLAAEDSTTPLAHTNGTGDVSASSENQISSTVLVRSTTIHCEDKVDIERTDHSPMITKRSRGRPKKAEVQSPEKRRVSAAQETNTMAESAVSHQEPHQTTSAATTGKVSSLAFYHSPVQTNSTSLPVQPYPPPPRNPTPQSVKSTSSIPLQAPAELEKQYVSPHMLWHDPAQTKTSRQSDMTEPAFFAEEELPDTLVSNEMAHKDAQEAYRSSPGITDAASKNSKQDLKKETGFVATNESSACASLPSFTYDHNLHPHQGLHAHGALPPTSSVPLVPYMAPVAPMSGIQSASPDTTSFINRQLLSSNAKESSWRGQSLDTPTPPNLPSTSLVPTVTETPKLLKENPFKEPIVQRISKRKAARKSQYDVRTIARDILLACGRHPSMPALNSHLFPLLDTLGFSVDKSSDLSTIRWDLIDPIPGGRSEVLVFLSDDDDLVTGDLEPIITGDATEDDIPSPINSLIPKGRQKKQDDIDGGKNQRKDRPSKQGKHKSIAKEVESEQYTSHILPIAPKSSKSRPRTSMGDLPAAAVVTHQLDQSKDMSARKVRGRQGNGVHKEYTASQSQLAGSPSRDLQVSGGNFAKPLSKKQSVPCTPAKASSHTPSFTPINGSVTPSRGELAAVVIESRSPSIANLADDVSSTRGKRKPDQPDLSARPRKRQSAVVGTVSANPKGISTPRSAALSVLAASKCGWKDCHTELHNPETLHKHVMKTHNMIAPHGGYPCLWEGCARPVTKAERKKGPKNGQIWDFATEKDWKAHVRTMHLNLEAVDHHEDEEIDSCAITGGKATPMGHIPLPPPSTQKRGPRTKSMGGRTKSIAEIVQRRRALHPDSDIEEVEIGAATAAAEKGKGPVVVDD